MKSEDEEIEAIKQHRIDVLKPLRCATMQEMVDELSKREGVKLYGPYDAITAYKLEGKGEATILVIKK